MFDSKQMKDKKKVRQRQTKTDMNRHKQTEIDKDPQKLEGKG